MLSTIIILIRIFHLKEIKKQIEQLFESFIFDEISVQFIRFLYLAANEKGEQYFDGDYSLSLTM